MAKPESVTTLRQILFCILYTATIPFRFLLFIMFIPFVFAAAPIWFLAATYEWAKGRQFEWMWPGAVWDDWICGIWGI